MFYYKILNNDEIGYSMSEVTIDFPTYIPIEKKEYDEWLEQEEARQKQQDIVNEQAELLARRREDNVGKAEMAYIEARLEEISDYWDSLEG